MGDQGGVWNLEEDGDAWKFGLVKFDVLLRLASGDILQTIGISVIYYCITNHPKTY